MIDIFLPNDTEALSISGTESVETALNWLTNYCKLGKGMHGEQRNNQ